MVLDFFAVFVHGLFLDDLVGFLHAFFRVLAFFYDEGAVESFGVVVPEVDRSSVADA